jgi:hypothetical protein
VYEPTGRSPTNSMSIDLVAGERALAGLAAALSY